MSLRYETIGDEGSSACEEQCCCKCLRGELHRFLDFGDLLFEDLF